MIYLLPLNHPSLKSLPTRQRHSAPNSIKAILFVAIIIIVASVLPQTSLAQWDEDGILLSSNQAQFQLAADSSGGTWYVWEEVVGFYSYVLRAQYIDPDGLMAFPDGGISVVDTDLENYSFTGAVPAAGSGVSIAFAHYSGDSLGWCIYGQILTLDGQRLLGPEGTLISGKPEQQVPPRWGLPPICTDGLGGWWINYAEGMPGGEQQVLVCGMNADGSPKIADPEDEPVIGTAPIDWQNINLGPDGEGGVFIVWQQDEGDYIDPRVTHIDALGRSWLESVQVFPNYRDDIRHPCPDGTGGGYLTLQSGRLLINRVLPSGWQEGSFPWGTNGIEVVLPRTSIISDPVLLSDGSVFIAANPISSGLHLIRRNLDGTSYYESEYITPYDGISGGNYIDAHYNQFDNGVIVIHTYYYPDDSSYLYAQKYDADTGAMIWDTTGVFITNDFLGDVGAYFETVETLNQGVSCLVLSEAGPYLYHLNPDGSVAGRPNEIRDDDIAQPPQHPLIASSWPNPFNATVSFSLSAPVGRRIRFEVFNTLGQRVFGDTIIPDTVSFRYTWKPDSSLGSGIYIVVLEDSSGENASAKKIVLMR